MILHCTAYTHAPHHRAETLFNTSPAWPFWTLQTLYFYILAATLTLIWTNLARAQAACRQPGGPARTKPTAMSYHQRRER